MATLSVDTPRAFENTGGHPSMNEYPIIADDIIYAGAAVGESSSDGTARPFVASDVFLGFCVETCDNTGGSAGDKRVKVYDKGVVWLTVTGADNVNDLGATVYASDDATFTLTASGATAIGKVKRYDASGKTLVAFESAPQRSI